MTLFLYQNAIMYLFHTKAGQKISFALSVRAAKKVPFPIYRGKALL